MAITDDNMKEKNYPKLDMNEEDILKSLSELEQLNEDIESGALDPLDMDILCNMPNTGFRGTNVQENALYIENDNKEKINRVKLAERSNKNNSISLKTGEYLSDFINLLPYGLIDK